MSIMNDLYIEATRNTPEIQADSSRNTVAIKGEAYPENAAKFYAPLFAWLNEYIESAEKCKTEVHVELIYFNSSSSKALFDFFELLDAAAIKGHQSTVFWKYHRENDMILEYGEEFAEEVRNVDFRLVELDD